MPVGTLLGQNILAQNAVIPCRRKRQIESLIGGVQRVDTGTMMLKLLYGKLYEIKPRKISNPCPKCKNGMTLVRCATKAYRRCCACGFRYKWRPEQLTRYPKKRQRMIVCHGICGKYPQNKGWTKSNTPIQCLFCEVRVPISDVVFSGYRANCPCCSTVLKYGYKHGKLRLKVRKEVKYLRDKPIIWSLAHAQP